ncbi:MAG: hypothetical protein KKF27_21590 [Gammaproteobacteria bacterium]|nr:hypothetical protein [Gammaproteobacteria bacterium]MBU2685843.1 hypothetical protein [Gammaproteobacteria bacterium]
MKKELNDRLESQAVDIINKVIYPLMGSRKIPVLDYNYIMPRVKQVWEESVKQLKFSDKDIEKLTKQLLRKKLKEVKKIKKTPIEDDDEQHLRCEPVIDRILDAVVDEALVFGSKEDEQWYKEALQENHAILFAMLVRKYIERIDFVLGNFAEFNFQRCLEKTFGKDKWGVTLEDMDLILKDD